MSRSFDEVSSVMLLGARLAGPRNSLSISLDRQDYRIGEHLVTVTVGITTQGVKSSSGRD